MQILLFKAEVYYFIVIFCDKLHIFKIISSTRSGEIFNDNSKSKSWQTFLPKKAIGLGDELMVLFLTPYIQN